MQDDEPSQYVTSGYRPPSKDAKARVRRAERLPFARVDIEAIAAIGRLLSPESALILELQRLSGQRRYKGCDGWVSLTQELLERVGLLNKDRRYKAMRRVQAAGIMEVRRLNTYGNKLEYRLNPDWVKPKAEVVDLTAVRKARRK
jgi:hypothetical protein